MMPSDLRLTKPILKVLCVLIEHHDDDFYGYEIMKLTSLSSGTLYPILIRLEKKGWVKSWWENSEEGERPRRRFYRITSSGESAVREALEEILGSKTILTRLRLRGQGAN